MRLKNIARAVVAVALLSAFGCSSNNKGKVEGTKWVSLAGTVKGQSIPAGVLKLEFGKDGSLTYDTPTGQYTGTYSLGMGDTITWNFTRELGGSKKHAQKCIVKGDRMTVKDSDGTSLDFEKVGGGNQGNPGNQPK